MFRQTSPPSTNDTPYGSVRDLPSFRELEQQLSAMKLLTYFIGRRQRHKLIEIERDMERLATTVDNFYERLGPRHWIFHDSLNVSTVDEVLNQTADAASAEARLIEVYRDKGASMYWIRRLRNVAGLRERFNQVIRAGCVATSGLRRQDGPPLASTVPGPPSCPATIRSNGASSNPPSSSSAFGGTCGMP